uniref:GH18 domain-containing protein n=1 Tax=Anopheles melas TaxID=34690 RepID=A0A182TUG2_9DIPT
MFEQRMWDSEQHVPYAVSGDQWVSYDDPQSIRKKFEFINSEGLGGAMILSIGQDEFQDGKFTLLRTLYNFEPVQMSNRQLMLGIFYHDLLTIFTQTRPMAWPTQKGTVTTVGCSFAAQHSHLHLSPEKKTVCSAHLGISPSRR